MKGTGCLKFEYHPDNMHGMRTYPEILIGAWGTNATVCYSKPFYEVWQGKKTLIEKLSK